MSEELDIRYFDVTIDKENIKEEITPILHKLKPEWQDKALSVKRFTEGKVNKMMCFYLEDDASMADGIVVRLNLIDLGDYVSGMKRETEFLAMQLAHAAGCFPPVYASFNNGVIYKYFQGRTVNFHDLIRPSVIRTITKKLHLFVNQDVDSVKLVGLKGENAVFDKSAGGFDVGGLIDTLPDKHPDPSKAEKFLEYRKELTNEFLRSELKTMQTIKDGLQMKNGLVHGDFHPKNIVLNEETGDVCFVDYEGTRFECGCDDLARVLTCRDGYVMMKMADESEPDITPEVRQMWLRSYLEAKYEHEGKNPDDVTDAEVEMMDIELTVIHTMTLFSTLAFVFVPMPFADEQFDLFSIVPHVKAKYFKQKITLPDLKTRHDELKKNLGI